MLAFYHFTSTTHSVCWLVGWLVAANHENDNDDAQHSHDDVLSLFFTIVNKKHIMKSIGFDYEVARRWTREQR